MGNAIGLSRHLLWLVLPMLAAVACVPTHTVDRRFDIPAQPAGPALNEFARQADITLIFSYDLVAHDRTHALKGRYTVDHGLAVLLDGTRLAYRRAPDGTYLICPRGGCAPAPGSRGQATPAGPEAGARGSGGNTGAPRLHDGTGAECRKPESISGERMQPCEAILS